MSNTMNDIINDIAKVGTMLVVSQALLTSVDSQASLQDKQWIQSSILTLIGFTAYRILTKKCINTDKQSNPVVKAVWDDWLQVGTMLTVSTMLSGGNLDMNWLRTSMYTLMGFTMYQVVTKHTIPNIGKTDTSKAVVNDWIKVGTMLVVSQVLSGSALDKKWVQSSLFTLLGFTAYQVVTKRFVPKL